MVTYQEENSRVIGGKIIGLIHAHSQEVVGPGANVNVSLFARSADAGFIRVYTAKNNGVIIGYCAYNVGGDLMRADVLTADCHAIYVIPEYRGRVSMRLIRYSEQCLIAEGCKAITVHSRPSAPALTRMYEKMGYSSRDITMRREV